MPGELIKVIDYNFNTKRRQITNHSTYFNERFGRSDFDEIKDPRRKGDAPAYLLKYIENIGEKIVYSKGLPQFVKSDIREEDIITAMGMEDNKLLLYDDFTCIDEGRLVGGACGVPRNERSEFWGLASEPTCIKTSARPIVKSKNNG